MTLELLTIDMFSDKIGEIFTIEESGVPPLELTLSEAAPIKNYANAARAPIQTGPAAAKYHSTLSAERPALFSRHSPVL